MGASSELPREDVTWRVCRATPVPAFARSGTDAYAFPRTGEVVVGCVLLAELGRGAASRVFLARQRGLADRPVVLKVSRRSGAEHLSLARLYHTNVVPLLSVHEQPARNLRVLVMPYLGGAPLSALLAALGGAPPHRRTGADLVEALDRLQDGLPVRADLPAPARQPLAGSSYVQVVCWLGACLADALEHAHERGLVHLDVKPANVLVAGDARPLLLDFHLAQPPLRAGTLLDNRFGGTEGYLSPEQAEALAAAECRRPLPRTVDARSDVYSLGVVLYEMLAGQFPPPEEATVRRQLREANPQVSAGLGDILARCLADDPARRYGDAAALAADLRRHLADRPLLGVPNRSPVERWRKWRRRRPGMLARFLLTAVSLVGLAAGLALLGWQVETQQRQAQQALALGQRLLGEGRPAEALRALERGQDAGWFPGRDALRQALADRAAQARTAQQEQERLDRRRAVVRELSRLAGELRFCCEVRTLPRPAAQALEQRCAALWQRHTVLDGPGWTTQERHDLVDLVAIWGELQLRLAAPPRREETEQRARQVLRQAERLCGAAGSTGQQVHTSWGYCRDGRRLLAANQLGPAAESFSRAVALQPDGFWPNFYQGVCALRLARHDEAVAAFRVCVALSPRSAPCYLNRALALTELGRLDEARADLDRALALDDQLGAAWLQRGVLSARQGRPELAVRDLNCALRHGSEPFRTHVHLAQAHLATGARQRACVHLRQALRCRPDEPTRRLLRRLEGDRRIAPASYPDGPD
jgi:tetratricopeptide (TPR) repeat protein